MPTTMIVKSTLLVLVCLAVVFTGAQQPETNSTEVPEITTASDEVNESSVELTLPPEVTIQPFVINNDTSVEIEVPNNETKNEELKKEEDKSSEIETENINEEDSEDEDEEEEEGNGSGGRAKEEETLSYKGSGEEEENEIPEKKSEETTDEKEVSEEEEEEDSPEEETEEKCTFNQFMSTLNISHFLPHDRVSLKKEFNSFQNIPERMRQSPSVNHTIQRLKRLMNMASTITGRQEFRSGLATFLQQNYELFLELELDPPCMTSLISIITAIRRSELWAIKYLDSMAKPPPGLLSGVTSFLGDFDQCISLASPESAVDPFHGQYCLLRPILPLTAIKKYLGESDEDLIKETKILSYLATYNVDHYVKTNPVLKFIEHMRSLNGRTLNIAICIPDLCSPKQLEKSLNRLLYPILGIPFELRNSSCWTMARTQDYKQYINPHTQFAIIFLALLGTLVLFSTVFEIYNRFLFCKQLTLDSADSDSDTSQTVAYLVTIFSAYFNTHRLLNPSQPRFAVIDTLRLVLIIMIGLCNAFYNPPLTYALRKMSQSVPYELLSNSRYFFIRAPTLLNDSLLVICGALFLRSVFRQLDTLNDVFSYALFLLRRWIRLTGPLFGSILFLYLLPMSGSGPLWDRLSNILMPACTSTSSLTSSLLYYSNFNFVKSNHTNDNATVVCNPDTWFLSIILQLNAAFFMLIVLTYQSPRNGIRLLSFFIAISIVLNISPKIFHSDTRTYYELTKQPSLWHLRRNYYLYHQNIIQYVGAFCVGLVLGYMIVSHENNKAYNGKNKKNIIYNCMAFVAIIATFIWINQFFVQNRSPNESSVLLFFSFGRLIFSIAFAWIIYACTTNKSPMLNSYLSFPSIQPIARLSFSIFLVQNLIQYHRMYSVKDTYVMTFRSTIENYVIDFFISAFVGYILYLMFEGPSQRIMEMMVCRDRLFEDNVTYSDPGDKRSPARRHQDLSPPRSPSFMNGSAKKIYDEEEKGEVISIRF